MNGRSVSGWKLRRNSIKCSTLVNSSQGLPSHLKKPLRPMSSLWCWNAPFMYTDST